MARLSRTLELEARRRAAGRYEYCLFPESASELPFHIDHIVAEKHGGQSESKNLGRGHASPVTFARDRTSPVLIQTQAS